MVVEFAFETKDGKKKFFALGNYIADYKIIDLINLLFECNFKDYKYLEISKER